MEPIPSGGLKVVGQQSAFGAILFGLKRLGFYALIAAVVWSVIPVIEQSNEEAEGKGGIVKSLIYVKNIMFILVDKIIGADANIKIKIDVLKTGASEGLNKMPILLSIFTSTIFLGMIFFGVRVPLVGIELSLTDAVQGFTGRTVPFPNVFLITLLIFFFAAGWYGSAVGNIDGYIPLEGITLLFKTILSEPRLFLP